MKKRNLIYIALSLLLTSGAFTSCDDYLDVNNNPNYPTTASLESLLPSAEANTIAQLGLNGQLIGSLWSQYVTQGNSTNQYNTTVNYSLTQESYNAFWTNAYANTLQDLKIMMSLAEEEEAWNYWVIGKIMTAYNYHMLTDLYGDIPFTEALNVKEYPAPKYDDSKSVVYPGIIKLLDEAIAKAPEAKGGLNPSIDNKDFFFKGDIDKWVALAKSLKLKIYLRDYESNKTQIASLISAGGLFTDNFAFTVYEDATNKGNPLYEYNIRQLNTKENIRACHTFLEFLLAANDPRIEQIYEITTAAKEAIDEGENLTTYRELYEGLPCGTKPSTTAGASEAVPLVNSSRYKQAYSDTTYLMNAAEAYFMIAEAQARAGKVAEAKTAYDEGVRKAFGRWGFDATDFIKAGGVYEFKSSSLSTMLKSILTQKWVAAAKANAWDAWMDRNRTGIPAISDAEKVRISNTAPGLEEGYELGSLVRPGTTVLGAREIPRRIPVPNVSALYNVNAPATKPTQEPLWWQVAQGN